MAINPANKKNIPIYIADYVLSTYGTGAIMAVPAHDQRDYEFAKKYDIPIIEVIKPNKENEEKPYEGEGELINSEEFNGISSEEAKEKYQKGWGGNENQLPYSGLACFPTEILGNAHTACFL